MNTKQVLLRSCCSLLSFGQVFNSVKKFGGTFNVKILVLVHATERKNVVALAQAVGYKPKISTPAVTTLTIYQLVPATGVGTANQPDSNYFLRIKDGLEVTSTINSNIIFRTTDSVDFAIL